ncbi:protein translocase subunit SecF [Leptospira licerasiae]|uniref:Protein-export membrane protein SecF n=1 Tax=Leptospira licerasiae str. MMD4847 TaxID=1049971 RepID=A0ABN0H8A9_9LEPT|nr:protein translocase subunit SecF [Leptospira licerasiae]EIE00289.1 export membrane protein SecF [Leptospira licerasiae serovar Varillal str. VAR 010]EJZ41730.1 export membrane protein SecF [Leptospira licerasiae str. MMD4847]
MFDFIKYKYISITFSSILILVGFGVTFGKYGGFATSLDFDGGLRAVVEFPENVERKNLEEYFSSKNLEAVLVLMDKDKNDYQIDIGLGSVDQIKQLYIERKGKDSVEAKQASAIDALIGLLQEDFKLEKKKILSANQVGSVVGAELTSTGISLLSLTLFFIMLYLSFRFQFKFALGAILALIHDLVITIAFIGFFQIKPSVPIIAALLTLLGYSINDTIVVFDRIRENAGNLRDAFSQVINLSINQTLARTFNTSVATLISVVAIIIGGAVELYDFAYVLTFGIILGTFSSVFIAAPLVDIYDTLSKRWKRS